ncbi:MAG: hypothetical protein AAGG80_01610 [Pseudomonadota bacterium]
MPPKNTIFPEYILKAFATLGIDPSDVSLAKAQEQYKKCLQQINNEKNTAIAEKKDSLISKIEEKLCLLADAKELIENYYAEPYRILLLSNIITIIILQRDTGNNYLPLIDLCNLALTNKSTYDQNKEVIQQFTFLVKQAKYILNQLVTTHEIHSLSKRNSQNTLPLNFISLADFKNSLEKFLQSKEQKNAKLKQVKYAPSEYLKPLIEMQVTCNNLEFIDFLTVNTQLIYNPMIPIVKSKFLFFQFKYFPGETKTPTSILAYIVSNYATSLSNLYKLTAIFANRPWVSTVNNTKTQLESNTELLPLEFLNNLIYIAEHDHGIFREFFLGLIHPLGTIENIFNTESVKNTVNANAFQIQILKVLSMDLENDNQKNSIQLAFIKKVLLPLISPSLKNHLTDILPQDFSEKITNSIIDYIKKIESKQPEKGSLIINITKVIEEIVQTNSNFSQSLESETNIYNSNLSKILHCCDNQVTRSLSLLKESRLCKLRFTTTSQTELTVIHNENEEDLPREASPQRN